MVGRVNDRELLNACGGQGEIIVFGVMKGLPLRVERHPRYAVEFVIGVRTMINASNKDVIWCVPCSDLVLYQHTAHILRSQG